MSREDKNERWRTGLVNVASLVQIAANSVAKNLHKWNVDQQSYLPQEAKETVLEQLFQVQAGAPFWLERNGPGLLSNLSNFSWSTRYRKLSVEARTLLVSLFVQHCAQSLQTLGNKLYPIRSS